MQELDKKRAIYGTTSPIGKALLLQSLHKAIDVADVAIKMSKNLHTDGALTAVAMKAKVKAFGEAVVAWGPHLLDTPLFRTAAGETISFERYCAGLQTALDAAPNQRESTLPTPGFSALAQAWGSNDIAAGTGQAARSIEDVFTTFHRTMLTCLSRAQQAAVGGNSSATTPPLVLRMKELLEKKYPGEIQYQGTSFDENGLSARYALPLQSHGMACEIGYDAQESKTTFSLDFYGEARERVGIMQSCLILGNACKRRGVIDPPQIEAAAGHFHAKWEVRSEEEARALPSRNSTASAQTLLAISTTEGSMREVE